MNDLLQITITYRDAQISVSYSIDMLTDERKAEILESLAEEMTSLQNLDED